MLSCETSCVTDPKQLGFLLFSVGTFCALPVKVIIIANIGILYLSYKHGAKKEGRGGLSRNALITVSCVCWGFVISVFPLTLRMMFQLLSVEAPNWFYVAQCEIYFLNVMCNPLIYTFTNRRFRGFLKSSIHQWFRCGLDKNLIKVAPQLQLVDKNTSGVVPSYNKVVKCSPELQRCTTRSRDAARCNETIFTNVSNSDSMKLNIPRLD